MTLPPAASPSFSIFYAGDAYSTAQKIMGRQSAGKQLIAGLARKYPESRITGLGPALQSKTALEKQLRAGGHKGDLAFELLPQAELLSELGTLYYPAPPTRELAYWRQRLGAQQIFSVMGVTHTLASKSASDQIADLVLPPFEDWDALICTSKAAQRFTENLQAEMRDYLRDAIGATHFSRPLLPLIPLGIDVASFSGSTTERIAARRQLGLADQEVVFLFAGRLSFHAKGNPIPMYWALEQAALKLSAVPKSPANDEQSRGARLGSGAAIVCLEAGVFPNEHIKNSFMTAQGAIAPHVRFIHIPGQDEAAYRMGWQAADVFVSLSDNVQETFGLTPVEAMAAGLPVLISDWNGYQDTVRHHVDGFKVPTIQAPAGAGELLALRHMLDVDSYDMYIGRASLATVVEPVALAEATLALASNHSLRQQMGAEGQRRALEDFDWAVILDRYDDLARELRSIRQASKTTASGIWPARADPFRRFSHFSSGPIQSNWMVRLAPMAFERFDVITSLSAANYGFDQQILPKSLLVDWLKQISQAGAIRIAELTVQAGGFSAASICALMWLWKFDVIRLSDD